MDSELESVCGSDDDPAAVTTEEVTAQRRAGPPDWREANIPHGLVALFTAIGLCDKTDMSHTSHYRSLPSIIVRVKLFSFVFFHSLHFCAFIVLVTLLI